MRTMYDSVTAADIPESAAMVAGYLDGPFAWSAADWARFPNRPHVGIVVDPSHQQGHVLDCETGDATPQSCPGWVAARRKQGAVPCVYMNASTWPAVRAAFALARVPEPLYWVAAYPGGGATIPAGAIAHQYADSLTSGGHYDLSVVADHWPGVDPSSPPPQGSLDGMGVLSMVVVHTPNGAYVVDYSGATHPGDAGNACPVIVLDDAGYNAFVAARVAAWQQLLAAIGKGA